jgi:hypothetical protein
MAQCDKIDDELVEGVWTVDNQWLCLSIRSAGRDEEQRVDAEDPSHCGQRNTGFRGRLFSREVFYIRRREVPKQEICQKRIARQ